MAESAYSAAFERAFAALLRDEGGYVNNPDDPGGETKFGISRREYPGVDIKNLTGDQAKAIYWSDFWTRFHFDEMPEAVAIKVFDLAVVMGPRGAIMCLQRACRACGQPLADDGVVGQMTLDVAHTISAQDLRALLAALRSEAAGYFRTVAALERGRRPDLAEPFLKGWLNRAYE